MNLPADRHMDPRWNACLDALTAAWNASGPDVTLAALSLLAGRETTAEVVQARAVLRRVRQEPGPLWAAAERARAEGRLKPLPRMPSVRPESDYEMDPPETMP